MRRVRNLKLPVPAMAARGCLLLLTTLALCAGTEFAHATINAAPSTWTNADAGNNNFTDADNWSSYGPQFNNNPATPVSLIFDGDPTVIGAPDLNGGGSFLQDLHFLTAGWTIIDSGSGSGPRYDDLDADGTTDIRSLGAGVNYWNAPFRVGSTGSERIIEVGAGNTLAFGQNFGFFETRFIGTGTFVVEGDDQTSSVFSSNLSFDDDITVLANAVITMTNPSLTQGTFGGTGGFIGHQFQTTTFAGTTIAPGGNGTFGAEIESLLFQSNSDSDRHEVHLNAGTHVEIQFGNTLGENDQILLDLAEAGGGNLTINSGVTLDLLNVGGIPDGDYTILQNLDADSIAGTFDTVTFNGAVVDLGTSPNFELIYNPDSVVVRVTGLAPATGGDVPEPSSLLILMSTLVGVFARPRRCRHGQEPYRGRNYA